MKSNHLSRIGRIALRVLPVLLICAAPAVAQVPADRDTLLNGGEAGQGMPAEVNGYPGPQHVLDLATELKLSETQKRSVQAIFTEMHARAKELGQTIVNAEEDLNSGFKNGLMSEKSIQDDTEEIGRMRAKLRAIHLVSHLKTQKILTPSQLTEYKKLRSTPPSPKPKK